MMQSTILLGAGDVHVEGDAESPLRLVDMALWVTRNNLDGRIIEC
jgi:hypothetical protein